MMIHHKKNLLDKERAEVTPHYQVSAGFTLVELLVTIAIISMLASIILTNVNSAREKARIAAGKHLYAQLDSTMSEVVGKWSFEEGSGGTVRDGSGYGNNGTINGGASWQTASQCGLGLGGCLSFDGVDDYIQVPHSESLAVVRQLTMTAWVYRTADCPVVADTCMIANKEFDYEFGIRSGNTLQWAIKPSGGTWFWHNTGIVVPQEKWTHVAISYDGSKVVAYRDGRREESFDYNVGDLERSGTVLQISGRPTQPTGSRFNGFIDEVRIYSEALTAYQIQQMYAEGASKHRVAENN